jgi:hypothetical protein
MIDRATVRKMCEYPYSPSLIGEAILDWAGLTAEQRAHRVWGMAAPDHERLEGKEEPKQ